MTDKQPMQAPGAGTPSGDFAGHGGQTDIAYHGPGQLGDEETDEHREPNSATRAD